MSHSDGRITMKFFRKPKAAEAAAYIAKIAAPDANVWLERTRGFALYWSGTVWLTVVFAVEGSEPVVKRMDEFDAALRCHDILYDALAAGVAFFR
ncbi:hypothetical protein [Paraburkholderia xenovorans]|uniref:hypothetical protein n=1 Tax=Paraburkholderia xenovorans TaxID=36873 RepID=UPI0038BAFCAA